MKRKPIAELFNLKGKGAIVTGGASGIGKGIALRLGEAGRHHLYVITLHMQQLARIKESSRRSPLDRLQMPHY